MPPKSSKQSSDLTDTWGRRNRKLADRVCPQCGQMFRPLRDSSKYCSRPCMWSNNGGHNRAAFPEPTWWLDNRGYIVGRVWNGDKKVFARQHRWIMEQHLGRKLEHHENIHHKNGDKTDNRLENLEIMDHGTHSLHHNAGRTYKRGYKLDLSPEERQRRSNLMREMRRQQSENS